MKETCQFYKNNLKRCIALRETYCDREDCSFYKPKGEQVWTQKSYSNQSNKNTKK
jgi:hypothetical protein